MSTSLFGTTWEVNELFVKEHTYEIVSVIEEAGEFKYGMAKRDLAGNLVRGLLVVTHKQLRQCFLQVKDTK